MRNIEGFDMVAKVNFANTKHHRQILRQTIRPELIQRLQTKGDPATNYKNAYRNIFKDELQKTMQQLNEKKIQNQYLKQQEKARYSLNRQHLDSYRDQYSVNNRGSPSVSLNDPNTRESILNIYGNPIQSVQRSSLYRKSPQKFDSPQKSSFVDYFKERTNKFENYVKNNYNGGTAFYQGQQSYLVKKKQQQQNYAQMLKKQLYERQNAKMNQRQKQNMEILAVKQMQMYQSEQQRQRIRKQLQQKEHLKMDKLQQIQQARQRKYRRQSSNKNQSISMHNPITNPIEFHIDNPYILKKIQQNSGM